MNTQSVDELATKRCVPCEGGVPKIPPDEAARQVERLAGWRLTHAGLRIRKDWKMKNFASAMAFLNRVAQLAEAEGHHPDLHVEGYRNVSIELSTHAIGGLSENDFIVAAKIDGLPAG